MGFESVILILVGLFSLAGGVFDWDWFMNNRRAVLMARILGGRRNARIFYVILGIGVTVLGIYFGLT
jgi:hypothetical protein